MSQREKRLQKARQNPKDVSFDELCQIYRDHGFIVESGGKGSHYIAKFPGLYPRTFPRTNPVKKYYVLKALEAIEELNALEGEGDRDE